MPLHALVEVVRVTPLVLVTLVPFASRRTMPSMRVELTDEDAAVPVKVIVKELIATAPAASEVNVIVPKSSFAVLEKLAVAPNPAAVTITLLLSTVCVFAAPGDERVMVAVAFEVKPYATIALSVELTVVSVEVANLNVCVLLSVAPLELYEDTSPFKASEIEPFFGTVTGFAKLNL